MNQPALTPTPRTDAAWAQTFDANGFLSGRGNAASQLRDECATFERELATLTAERNQLRAEVEDLKARTTQDHGIVELMEAELKDLKSAGGPPFIRSEAIRNLRDQVCGLKARAERAEAAETIALANWNGALERAMKADADLAAALALGQQNCDDAYDELRGDCDELRADVVRLTAERDELRAEHAEMHKSFAGNVHTENRELQTELAAERTRLDSGTILLTVAGERVWHCGVDLRAAIDAGIREGAK
jgi:chromosome segregation ATPase